MIDNAFFDELTMLAGKPAAMQQQPTPQRPKGTEKRAPTKKAIDPRHEFSTLVKDKLYYQVALSRFDGKTSDAPSTLVETAKGVFVGAFNEVWDRLPELDQYRLLDTWHHPPREVFFLEATPLHPRPLIRIVDVGEWTPAYHASELLGHELSFPIALILHHSYRLRFEIARALATAHPSTTRLHWHLMRTTLFQPLDEWEEAQATVTDAAYDQKLAELEGQCMKEHKKHVAQLLTAWGIEEPSGVDAPSLEMGMQKGVVQA